jgi:hypothetical protein
MKLVHQVSSYAALTLEYQLHICDHLGLSIFIIGSFASCGTWFNGSMLILNLGFMCDLFLIHIILHQYGSLFLIPYAHLPIYVNSFVS